MTTEEDVGGATGGPTAEDNMSAVAAVGAAVAGAGVVGAFVAPRTVGTVDGTAEGFRVGANDK